jgi:hypothetical protein
MIHATRFCYRLGIGLALCGVFVGSIAVSQLAAQDEKAGWVAIRKPADWTTTGNWKLGDEGVIVLEPRPGEKGWQRYDAYLWLHKPYKDFEIEFEDKKEPVAKGIEVQIYDAPAAGKEEKLTDHTSGGVIPGIPPTKSAGKPAGEWNKFQIARKGNDVTVKLNGETVNEFKLDNPRLKGRPDSGYIGFQDHGLPLALRNIRIRAL